MDLLARREHSRLELARKLESRGFAPAAIDPALDDLERDRLLDDGRFAESFAAARARKGQGPARIRAELRERGIDEADAARGLAEADPDWARIAGEVRRKRFGDALPTDYAARARQAKFLQYRGFEPEQIRAALDNPSDSD